MPIAPPCADVYATRLLPALPRRHMPPLPRRHVDAAAVFATLILAFMITLYFIFAMPLIRLITTLITLTMNMFAATAKAYA